MSLSVRPLTGPDLLAVLDDVARLRIEVFRDFPYLYDGDLDYERDYIATYARSRDALVVGAFGDGRLVGAATGTPMEDHAAEFAAAMAHAGLPLTDVFYCAESVLLAGYRGRGIGHRFFDLREAHARQLGRRWSAFCAVIRPANHPDRPQGYRALDPFWTARGYRPLPGALAEFRWRDVGGTGETAKKLQFWAREI